MKTTGMAAIAVLFCLMAGSSVSWAGGADNKTNWSAEYIGILNRNAATDSADIVMYNPAGVMKMANGLYGNLSAHYIAKDYNNRINGTDFDQDEPSIVPGLFAVYKKDDWAGFFGVSNVIGGGKVAFEQGNATTNLAGVGIIQMANAELAGAGVPQNFYYTGIAGQNLSAEHLGLAYTIGGAFRFNDMWSAAVGVRYVRSEREMDGSISVSAANPFPMSGVNDPLTANVAFEEDADGIGGVFGVNFSPTEKLNIGLHYDTKVNLDYEQTVSTDNLGLLPSLGIVHNNERTRNLPAVLAAGVSYQVHPKFRMETNLTLYLNQNAGFADIPQTSRDESAVDNGYDLGVGFEYTCTDSLRVTLGYLYTSTGVDAENMTPELPELDSHSIGAGLRWQMNEKLGWTFALGRVFYDDASFVSPSTGATVTYEKDITFVAVGAQYKFF